MDHSLCKGLAGDPFAASALPLYQTATFRQSSAERFDAFDYTRTDNPTRAHVERRIAALERGSHGLLFASGMAAIDGVLALVPTGGRLVIGRDLYGGTLRLVRDLVDERGLELVDVDAADADALARAIDAHRPHWVWLESPTNPLQDVVDLRAAAAACRRAGARLAVDNTMLSSWLQQPSSLGADAVVLSATKHLGGHADLTAGAVVVDDPDLAAALARRRNTRGTALAPFEAWLLDRGLETLEVRVERQTHSARSIAERLAVCAREPGSPITGVRYAGLTDHPGHALLVKQARGAGSVLCVEFACRGAAVRFVEALERFAIAVSFGSTRSTASLPSAMSHASVPAGLSATIAPPAAGLVRLSIGLEDPRDLVDDVERALVVAATAPLEGSSSSDTVERIGSAT
ncbi:Cystathionine beta-lyase [Planctomycetes bacterium Pla163]|uniref:Cystathionine beta-lyase n=1 Tax=Rohdeia mirabilis TaxID=2528008 RepID=A0A518D4F9_9BACT|nr:Cystathionine beta-lyase [Planctomycetes bacterium Pla163]